MTMQKADRYRVDPEQLPMARHSIRETIAFGAVLVFGIALRFFQLGRQGLFVDEVFSLTLAQLPWGELVTRSFQDGHPPLYYLLLKTQLLITSPTEANLRLISALCSGAALTTLMAWLARRYTTKAAIYAGWFFTLSSFDLYYAQEARMYTLMSFLWLLGYVLLVEGLYGRPQLLIGWGVANGLLAWSHFYGVFALGIHFAFAAALWLASRRRLTTFTVPSRQLAMGTALSLVIAAPVLIGLWLNRAREHGGTWLPTIEDLGMLLGLWSIGLTAARSRFLDSSHLVVPIVSNVGPWLWALAGMLISGGFAAWALWQELRKSQISRWIALLSLALIAAPILFVYSYSVLFELRMWALRAFLGAAYLFYLWAGVGLSRVSSALVRRFVVVAMFGIAALSFQPYFSSWQKTDAHRAFGTISTSTPPMVLLEPNYLNIVASYYLGPDADLVTFARQPTGDYVLMRMSSSEPRKPAARAQECSADQQHQIREIWLYGNIRELLENRQQWPSCMTNTTIRIFENDTWKTLDR